MFKSFYKGYWMVTNRCNLRCSYCVLENAPHQLKAELDLPAKKEFIFHLYHKLNFRRLTLSGGEVLIFGKKPPYDFIEFLRYIRQFKSSNPSENLEIELYTNGTYLDEHVANEMKGVIDMIAVTIDTIQDNVLTSIGRNTGKFTNYFDRIVQVCGLISKSGIELKLHSVINTKNYLFLADEVPYILSGIEKVGGRVSYWKFYQYMSYDVPEKDALHSISKDFYEKFQKQVESALANRNVLLHFKSNEEMNASLFNILSYGNAQYMRQGDTWSTSKRTQDLRSYSSMEELFTQHDIDEKLFRQFHEISR